MESVFGTAGELTPAVLWGGLWVGSRIGAPAEGSG